MIKNYYKILSISRNANQSDIKKAYRDLAQKFHPDKNKGANFFEEKFKEIAEAYETLSDPVKKLQYDIKYDRYFKKERRIQPTSPLDSYSKKRTPEKENTEKERVAKIKKNTELSFEDKAWIFIGNWLIIPGAVGLWMFFKYRRKGYTKKSNTVCSLTLISFLVILFLYIIILAVNEM